MSDNRKLRRGIMDMEIAILKEDSSISENVKSFMIDMFETLHDFGELATELQDKVKDMEESLKDKDAQDRR